MTIIPDFNEPTAKCRVSIAAETEQRATDGQTWDPAPELDRRARAQALLSRIREAVGGDA